MNTKKFIEVGNLFNFAENRLQKKVNKGEMEFYTRLDVIDNAIKLRKYLDKHPEGLKIPKQTTEERKYFDRKRKQDKRR